MAKIVIEHVNMDSRPDERGIEGVVHLLPGGITDFNTLCGIFSFSGFERAEGIPTCAACISQAKAVYAGISKKELDRL
jgi:hypothetical protein